jgi:hypothetical protein
MPDVLDSQWNWKRCGAGGRTRTDMSLTSPDFESGAYTNFATPAPRAEIIKPVALGRNYVDQSGASGGRRTTSGTSALDKL